MYQIFDKIIYFITKAMENWKVELAAGGQTQREVKIQRDIFQDNSLTPLLFVIAMMLFNYMLRKHTSGFKFTSL